MHEEYDGWTEAEWQLVDGHLRRIMGEMAAAEIDFKHIVVSTTKATGASTYRGPFPTALDALLAADKEEHRLGLDGSTGQVIRIAPLYEATPPGLVRGSELLSG
jgi:hypothetical protein